MELNINIHDIRLEDYITVGRIIVYNQYKCMQTQNGMTLTFLLISIKLLQTNVCQTNCLNNCDHFQSNDDIYISARDTKSQLTSGHFSVSN